MKPNQNGRKQAAIALRGVPLRVPTKELNDDLHVVRGTLLAVVIGAVAWLGMSMLIWMLV